MPDLTVHVTEHAIQRYRERVADVSDEQAVAAIVASIVGAKDSSKRRLKRQKNTVIIRGIDCYLICSKSKVLSVVKQMRHHE